MKQIYVESYYRNGYSRFMKYLEDITNHPKRLEIEKRISIIDFFDEYGAAATKKAFGKSRTTVYRWKQKLKKCSGKLSSLAPGDTAPIHRRKRVVHPFIEDFIIKNRTAHPGIDKASITPILSLACKRQGIKPVSESTVGRIISDLKAKRKLPSSQKISLNGKTGRLLARGVTQKKKKVRRKDYKPEHPGDLVQMDTVSVFSAGIKRYIFTAIDVSTRFAFASTYKSNSSANGSDFLGKFLSVAPFAIKRIQTDNGSEFAKDFAQSCQGNRLVHFFNYPKHPESNGLVERFNRTIQAQFVYSHIDYIDEIDNFNRLLTDYLIWYNTERPHRGIGKIPPLRYYVDNFLSPSQSHMYWTLTEI
jgi:putative transposase